MQIINDTLQETKETFDFLLSNPKGIKIDGSKRATISIVDDDPCPQAAARLLRPRSEVGA